MGWGIDLKSALTFERQYCRSNNPVRKRKNFCKYIGIPNKHQYAWYNTYTEIPMDRSIQETTPDAAVHPAVPYDKDIVPSLSLTPSLSPTRNNPRPWFLFWPNGDETGVLRMNSGLALFPSGIGRYSGLNCGVKRCSNVSGLMILFPVWKHSPWFIMVDIKTPQSAAVLKSPHQAEW